MSEKALFRGRQVGKMMTAIVCNLCEQEIKRYRTAIATESPKATQNDISEVAKAHFLTAHGDQYEEAAS